MHEELNNLLINCVQSFLLGIIQGFTEFLPISSTAHLKVVPYFLGWNDPGVSISASLQLGSVFAIFLYFRDQIFVIIKSISCIFIHRNLFLDENTRLTTYILVASLPIVVVGFFIKLFWPDYVTSNYRGLFSIAVVSIAMSFLLAISEIYGVRKKSFSGIKLRDMVLIGFSQSLAIIPGVSRSGVTLTAALLAGIERQTAARLSFLVGIPAILLSGSIEFFSLYHVSSKLEILPTIIGIISSFFSSIIAIDFLLKFLAKNNTFIFVYYRLAFGVFILSTLIS